MATVDCALALAPAVSEPSVPRFMSSVLPSTDHTPREMKRCVKKAMIVLASAFCRQTSGSGRGIVRIASRFSRAHGPRE